MKGYRYISLILFCVIAVSIIGCGKKTSAVKTKSGIKGPILAEIGDEVITVSGFEDRISRLPDNVKKLVADNRGEYLENLIIETLLYKEALKNKLDKDEEVQELFTEAKKRIVMARLVKERVEDKIDIDDEELEDFYKENKEDFRTPELYRASHILVNTLEEAVDIIDRLNAGALFEELAKKYSLDATSKRGGDVGYFRIGEMLPAFEDTCLRLKIGEMSGPVKTKFGYHIIMLTDKKESELQKFDEVKDKIGRIILAQKRRDLFDNLVADLKSKTNVTVHRELIEPEVEAEETIDEASQL